MSFSSFLGVYFLTLSATCIPTSWATPLANNSSMLDDEQTPKTTSRPIIPSLPVASLSATVPFSAVEPPDELTAPLINASVAGFEPKGPCNRFPPDSTPILINNVLYGTGINIFGYWTPDRSTLCLSGNDFHPPGELLFNTITPSFFYPSQPRRFLIQRPELTLFYNLTVAVVTLGNIEGINMRRRMGIAVGGVAHGFTVSARSFLVEEGMGIIRWMKGDQLKGVMGLRKEGQMVEEIT